MQCEVVVKLVVLMSMLWHGLLSLLCAPYMFASGSQLGLTVQHGAHEAAVFFGHHRYL